MIARHFKSPGDLIDPVRLAAILGRADHVRVAPMQGVGYTTASLSRVDVAVDGASRSFVLKRTDPRRDWTACRTGDTRGREALLVGDAAFAPVWDIFASPYVAYAAAPGDVGLLMDDLTSALLPDVRAPLSDEDETALLGALARMHARFWNADVLTADWLVTPAQYCEVLAPAVAADRSVIDLLSPALQTQVPLGWASAFTRTPGAIAWHLMRPGLHWQKEWADLPWTLLHGDAKVANFARLSDGRVAAFDWAMAGAGPCTIDLGWYLAVNASRLTGSKEAAMSRYRALLETALDKAFPESIWYRLEHVAIVCGARMLLWSKALAVDSGRPGAEDEWNWWMNRLEPDASLSWSGIF